MARTTIVSFLLDETGSMQSIKDDTIGGFNAYLDTLEKADAAIEFHLVSFDSTRIRQRCAGIPPNEVERLTEENYQPGAMTPLIDAAMELIKKTKRHVDRRTKDTGEIPLVTVVIQTDGHENNSTKFKREDLAKMVKKMTKRGWEFVYLAAGIDAFAEAASYGIAAANTMSYDKGNTREAFAVASAKTVQFVNTGGVTGMSMDASDREAAGEDKVIKKRPIKKRPIGRGVR